MTGLASILTTLVLSILIYLFLMECQQTPMVDFSIERVFKYYILLLYINIDSFENTTFIFLVILDYCSIVAIRQKFP